MYSWRRFLPVCRKYSRCEVNDLRGVDGIQSDAQICPCGWGFEHPMIGPLFSKIVMYEISGRDEISSVSDLHVLMIATISA
jgi:hypothetical protein